MVYLMQILNRLDTNNLDLFEELFTDISYEIEYLGYENSEYELINEMLNSHFGLTIEDDRQLQFLTKVILNPDMLKSGISAYKSLKGIQ